MILKQGFGYNRLFWMVTSASHYLPLTGAAPAVLLSKAGAAFGAAAGAVTEVSGSHGFYQVALTAVDTNTGGDLAYYITAASGDAVFMVDQVQSQIFPDLSLNASGYANIASNIKQNAICNGFMFIMTNNVTHAPQTGLTVTAQRSLGGAGFAPCLNPVTELSNGVYVINLGAVDTNANNIMYRFTASGADDLDMLIVTQP